MVLDGDRDGLDVDDGVSCFRFKQKTFSSSRERASKEKMFKDKN
jgi:hypothetical protein